jgi:hypothetical protein
MSRAYFFAFVWIAAFAMLPQPSFAQWSEAERSACVKDCVGTCSTNPNVAAPLRSKCPEYCECACQGAEKAIPNFTQFNEEFGSNQDNERTRAVREAIPACNAKTFR